MVWPWSQSQRRFAKLCDVSNTDLPVLESRLRAAGVDYWVANDAISRFGPWWPIRSRIMVPREQYEAARAILEHSGENNG